ncbi:MAG: hypothetical protein LBV79_05545 [Candidatus Adiutrix sp.]|jgi:flagellar biosynthesis protein FlhF|nr:hypothetical protein [Candidatus Adiutrix sp.]
MKIKRFTARDLPTATSQIKEEFGLAAIILSQRDLPPEEGGGVEITAGVRDEDLPRRPSEAFADEAEAPAAPVPPMPAPPASVPTPAPAKPRAGQAVGAAAYRQAARSLSYDSEGLTRKDIDALGLSLGRGLGELKDLILDLAHRQSLSEKWRDRPDLVSLYRRLLETGLAAEYARSLVESAAESARAWGGEIGEHLRKTLRPKLRIADLSLAPPKYLALVGPSGAGKTTTLVNLAAFYRQRGLKAAAITLDTLKLGAAEQLTQYARILGLGVRVCQNREEFREALEIFETSDLILIDTPSRGFQKDEGRRELAAYFDEAEAAALLVLPATMKEGDLAAALAKARAFREAGLVVTKFDETETLGNLLGFLMTKAPKLAFFTQGPKTSEDFIMASADRLLDMWLEEG